MSVRSFLETRLPSRESDSEGDDDDDVRDRTSIVSKHSGLLGQGSSCLGDRALKAAPHSPSAMVVDMARSDSSDCEGGGTSGFESCYESFPEEVARFNLDSGSEVEDIVDIPHDSKQYSNRPLLRVNAKKMQTMETIYSNPNSPATCSPSPSGYSSGGGSPLPLGRHLRKPMGRTAAAGCGDGFVTRDRGRRRGFDGDPEPEPGPSSPLPSPKAPALDSFGFSSALTKVQLQQSRRRSGDKGKKTIHLGPKPAKSTKPTSTAVRRSDSPEEEMDESVLDIWKLEGQGVDEELEMVDPAAPTGNLKSIQKSSSGLTDSTCAWAATNLLVEPLYQDTLARNPTEFDLDRLVIKLRKGVEKYDCTGMLIDCF